MSKPIKMTEQTLNECREAFEDALKLAKLADGKICFTKTFNLEKRTAVVYFTAEAWAKMVMLINSFSNEVAWHGVAHRVESQLDEYIISDILVYPQTVTGASVDMDTEKYATWLQENAEDDRFYNIHMQGHSHVNMATTPSSVDLNHQEEILQMLDDNNFYIFMIWNKSLSSNIKIYDMQKNILFENSDITVKIIGENENLEEFLKTAKSLVKTKTYTYNKNTSYNPASYQKQDDKKTDKDDKKHNDKKEKPKTTIGNGWIGSEYYGGGTDYYGYY